MSNLLRMYFAIAFVTASQGWVQVAFSPYLAVMQYSVVQIGLLVSLIGILRFASRLPSGALYSTRRAKRLLLIGLLSLAGSMAGFGLAPPKVLMIGLIVLHGLATGLITTVAMALCVDMKPTHRSLGDVMGWYMAAVSVGYAGGQLVGGYMSDQIGFRTALFLMAALVLLAVLLVKLLPSSVGDANAAEREKFGIPTNDQLGQPIEKWSLDFRRIPTNALMAGSIMFLFSCLLGIMNAYYPLYALSLGLSLTTVGLLRSFASLVATFIRPSAGYLFARVNYRLLNHVSLLLACVCIGLIPTTTAFSWLMLLYSRSRSRHGHLTGGDCYLGHRVQAEGSR